MNISLHQIIESSSASILGAFPSNDIYIKDIAFDTRKINVTEDVLFICLAKYEADILSHIQKAIGKGIKYFLVPENISYPEKDVLFLCVPSVIIALQDIAIHHRQRCEAKVLGITGSNGKTIIKEWLAQILSHQFHIAKSPASYNSQLGVPLSVLQLEEDTEIGIFEAGISEPGEMKNLEPIISCDIGILSNIGDAHDEGFENKEEKLIEKLHLFAHASIVIFEETNIDNPISLGELSVTKVKLLENLKKINPLNKSLILSWSTDNQTADYQVRIEKENNQSLIRISGRNNFATNFQFTDQASISNIIHVIICCLELGIETQEFRQSIRLLEPVSMRLMLKKVSRNCMLVDDSYNADLTSLKNALDFAHEQKKDRKLHVIMTDFEQVKRNDFYYKNLAEILEINQVDRLSYIGKVDSITNTSMEIAYYDNTQNLKTFLEENPPQNEIILLKGARKYKLDALINSFQLQTHKTQLHISLDAIRNNIQHYRKMLPSETEIMAVIKAGAYGSDSIPLAKHLLKCGVEYLAVAYFDEAIELRKEGITAPIMIMNPDPSLVFLAEKYDLELEIYSPDHLKLILDASQKSLTIHLKIDSGMHRLGFSYEDLDILVSLLQEHNDVRIKSIFSHFSSSEDEQEDDFTKGQFLYYRKCVEYLKEELGLTKIMQHVCNSSAALRFPQYHLDMIRLGIGLYGYVGKELQMAHRLTSYVAQVKTLKPGDSVGYNRAFIAEKEMKIATINIGYADGLSRKLGNGNFSFIINGTETPTVGNISMDTCTVDISSMNITAGEEVIIYDSTEQFQKLARVSEQTAYEVISHTGPRVVRSYKRFE